MGSDNLRVKTLSLDLSKNQVNMVFQLHNTAVGHEYYGQELYVYLLALVEGGKIKQETADDLFLLSIDWP